MRCSLFGRGHCGEYVRALGGLALRASLITLVLALAIGGCSGSPKEPVAAPTRTQPEDPCDKARRQRARVPDLLAHGKLDRTIRVLRHADTLCPKSAAESWAPLVQTLAEVGRYEEATKLAVEIDESPKATEEARAATKTARAVMAERDGYFPNTAEAKAPMRALYEEADRALTEAEKTKDRAQALLAKDKWLAAWNAWRPNGQALYGAARMARLAGDEPGAQRLFDRSAVELEAYARDHLRSKDARTTLDTPNGFGAHTIHDVAWSHRASLLAISHDLAISISSTRTWREKLTLPPQNGPSSRTGLVAFTPDGRVLASSGLGWIKLWDVETGTLERSVEARNESWVTSIAFSPDSKTLAVGRSTHEIDFLDVTTGQWSWSLAGHEGDVYSVAFSPKGDMLASASSDGVRIWDLHRRKMTQRLDALSGGVHCVAFSPDGRLVASGSLDGTTHVSDVSTGRLVQSLPRSAPRTSVQFSTDGKSLITNGNAWLFDLASEQPIHALPGQQKMSHLALNATGDLLADVSEAGLTLWKVGSGERLHTIRQRHARSVSRVTFSPTVDVLAAGTEDGTIELWDATTGRLTQTVKAHDDTVFAIRFSPDGRWLASGGSEGAGIRLWTADGVPVRTLAGGPGVVNALAFHPNSDLLASPALDKIIRIWRVPSGELARELDATGEIDDYLDGIAFGPRGETLVSGGTVTRIWDVKTGSIRKRIDMKAWDLAFDRGGTVLFALNGEVERWDMSRETFLEGFAQYNVPAARHFALSPDGKTLAVDRDDLYLLDTDSRVTVRRLTGHANTRSIAFSPSSSHLAWVFDDGQMSLWSVTDGRALWLRAVSGTTASYVFTRGPDARIEFFGDEGRKSPVCRIGPLSYEFDLCAEWFEEPGLGKKFLANDLSYLDP